MKNVEEIIAEYKARIDEEFEGEINPDDWLINEIRKQVEDGVRGFVDYLIQERGYGGARIGITRTIMEQYLKENK